MSMNTLVSQIQINGVDYVRADSMPVAKPNGKRRRHFTLSDQAFDHLTAIAHDSAISRSETLKRLVRSTDVNEGSSLLSDAAWLFVIDFSSSS